MRNWLNRDVLLIALSAFFADTGYQVLISGFPIYLVLVLNAPVYLYGIIMAIVYGGGAIFAYFGGKLSDSIGRKKIAVIGNSFISILSFSGAISNVIFSGAMFSFGWWSRDFRTGARRAMLREAVSKKNVGKAYGFLHALDIAGAFVAAAYLIILLYIKEPFSLIFFFTIIPLSMSTLCLIAVRAGKKIKSKLKKIKENYTKKDANVIWSIIIATSLYGFSYYSFGFPVLTISQSYNPLFGVGSFAVLMGVSSVSGMVIGYGKSKLSKLGWLGYIMSGIGSLAFALSYAYGLGILISYAFIALIGFGFGAIETLEPSIISVVSKNRNLGSNLGALTAARGVGLFTVNLLMGILYFFSPTYSYSYAGIVALAAGVIVIVISRRTKR